jgi:hypothetical protein
MSSSVRLLPIPGLLKIIHVRLRCSVNLAILVRDDHYQLTKDDTIFIRASVLSILALSQICRVIDDIRQTEKKKEKEIGAKTLNVSSHIRLALTTLPWK